jgi:hypothetical protein
VSTAILSALLLLSCAGGDEKDQVADVVKKLNAYRKSAGLPPVTLDDKLSKACQAHAKYLATNFDPEKTPGWNPHREDPKLPGYSREGDLAARRSEISFNAGAGAGAIPALDGLFACFFHRIAMIHPNLRKVGVGYVIVKDRHFLVLDDRSGREARRFDPLKPIVYPGEMSTDVPREFAGNETPDPLPPEGRGKKAGFPITASFAERARITRVSAVLKEDDKPVPCWVSSPEKPATTRAFQFNSICLIPKEPLKAKTTYEVTVAATVDGKPWRRTWSFTTRD